MSETITKVALALSHFTDDDELTPYSVEQAAPRGNGKPRGLWVSVDGEDDWPAWNKAENFRDTDAQHRYQVTLSEDANILHLSGMADLLRFTEQYGEPTRWGDHSIRWAEVAADYQGIIISPYSWTGRLELFWYYGWDCASGCIWDAAAIAEVSR